MHELDKEMAKALEHLRADTATVQSGPQAGTMQDARDRARQIYAYWNQQGPELFRVRDIEAEGAFGERSVRLYYPNDSTFLPLLVYAHGGGWIVGDLDLEDWALRYLSLKGGFAIASLDYVLAPEHTFPEPIEDCVALTRWLRSEALNLGLDPQRIAIGGGSAGANLSLATAISLRDQQDNWLKGIANFYGVYGTSQDTASYTLFNDARYQAGSPGMAFFLSRYLTEDAQLTNPLVNLLEANFDQLPPVFIAIAELDVLRDDNLLLAEHLESAGVETSCISYPGTIHGFTVLAREVTLGRKALEDAATSIKLWFNLL